jgi:hypothetical protein
LPFFGFEYDVLTKFEIHIKSWNKGSQGISSIISFSFQNFLSKDQETKKRNAHFILRKGGNIYCTQQRPEGWSKSKVWEGGSAENRQDNDTIITHWKHTPFSHPQAHHVTRTIRAHYFKKYTSKKHVKYGCRWQCRGSGGVYPGSRIRIFSIPDPHQRI